MLLKNEILPAISPISIQIQIHKQKVFCTAMPQHRLQVKLPGALFAGILYPD